MVDLIIGWVNEDLINNKLTMRIVEDLINNKLSMRIVKNRLVKEFVNFPVNMNEDLLRRYIHHKAKKYRTWEKYYTVTINSTQTYISYDDGVSNPL